MNLDTRLAAFIEYVIRPMSDDWRQILDQLVRLNIGITPQMIKEITFSLGCWHLLGELIRAATYLIITWMICHTLLTLWPLL